MTTLGEEAFAFFEHTYALIPPSLPHDERHSENGAVICLLFSCDEALSVGVKKDTLGTVLRLLREMLDEAKRQAYGYEDMINAKLKELCVLLARDKHRSTAEKDFAYVINYLRENYHEHILLSDLAARLGISYDYFQHKFKTVTGLSPQRFLLRRRLEAARVLLRAQTLACTDIAYRCGFSTSAQFSALFKREYGMSPSRFRRE